MADVLTPEQRSRCMSAVRDRNTVPELFLRRLLHSLGYRYRIHDSRLPGKPDLVFPKRRKAIFVHGCFWHRHNCKSGRSLPSTRRAFWTKKLQGNQKRDRRQALKLRKSGWKVLTVWQCQLKETKAEDTLSRVISFLGAEYI
ncbi:MAG: very short patch repair endonuclease [Acidobacteria bacterium]|nr:MAG: very short patch repair endonuclease [Acidobacteriota bacterium]